MTEPIDDATPPLVPPAGEPPTYAPPTYAPPPAATQPPPWTGEYAAVPPVLPAAPMAAPGKADPLRGILAGLIAAVVGAALWALLVALTHYEIGILAVAVGYGVGWAVHRFGGVASTGLAAGAAALAAFGVLLGFILAGLFLGAHEAHIGVMDAVQIVSSDIGWPKFIGDSVGGIGWLFLAIGAFAAFRLVAQQRRR
jgi:hypothetical protein